MAENNSNTHGTNPYFNIFSKLSREFNVSVFLIMFIVGIVFFHLFNWHIGNLKYAIEREKVNLNNIEELKDSINNNDPVEVNLIENLVFKEHKESSNPSRFEINDILTNEEVEVYIKGKIASLNKIWASSLTVDIPFIGIRVVVTDYILLLLYIGLLLFIWLFSKLNQLRFSLTSYLNDFRVDSKIDEVINSLFYTILPRRRFYRYYEFILSTLIIAFISLTISNTYEIFFDHHSYSQKLINQPGWIEFRKYVLITYIISLIGIASSIFLYQKSRQTLTDIRNLLIILKSIEPFWSALYYSFSERNDQLVQGRNFIEYGYYKNSKYQELIISVQRKRSNQLDVLHDQVNLPERFIEFSQEKKNLEIENYNAFDDDHLKRPLTREEEIMKRFFTDLLTNDSNKNSIADRYLAITGETRQSTKSNTERIRFLLVNGKTYQALQETLLLTKLSKYNSFNNDIITYSNKISNLNQDNRKGTLMHQEYIRETTKIVDSLLLILEEIDKI